MNDTRLKIFLAGVLHLPHAELLGADTPLLATGAFDSLGVLELCDFLEREHGIDIDAFTLEDFASLRRIDAFVARCLLDSGRAGHLSGEGARGTA